jgi:hypothetical protein
MRGGGGGSSGSIAAHVASTTSASSARMMSRDLPGRLAWIALGITASQPADRRMVTSPNKRLTPIRATP